MSSSVDHSVEARLRARPRVAGQRSRARGIPPAPAPEQVGHRTKVRREQPRPARPGEGPKAAAVATVSRRRRWLASGVALVAALTVLGLVLGVSLRDPDAAARSQRAAVSQARTSIEQMLSYNYKTIDAQAAQIEALLTGPFKTEFSQAMDKDIKPLAVRNQTVVQARVTDVGVMSATTTTVKVLAFVNQARVGVDQKEPTLDQNRVIATLTKVGDRWLISKVAAF